MIKFPLYDLLLNTIKNKEDKCIDVTKICSTITSLAIDENLANIHYTQIAVLILHHELVTNSGVLLSIIPYDGKLMCGGRGILYSFIKFPPLLQQIISQYIDFYSF